MDFVAPSAIRSAGRLFGHCRRRRHHHHHPLIYRRDRFDRFVCQPRSRVNLVKRPSPEAVRSKRKCSLKKEEKYPPECQNNQGGLSLSFFF